MNIISELKSILLLPDILLAISVIKELSPRDKIIVCHTLNKWEFPELLKYIKPRWWDRGYHADRKHKLYIGPVRGYIKSVISQQESYRYHIVEYLGKSEEYFNDWWEVNKNEV